MAILTKAQFAYIAETKAGYSGLRGNINENTTRNFSLSESATSIFSSHSHHDKAVVEQAKVFFETLGLKIYVDWADETMPEKTNGLTAKRIKEQIMVKNDKFVLLATNNAITSKWCNWEVGIADPFKLHKKKMIILPLSENSGTWQGNEYLQIYPRIERNPRKSGGEDYYVWYPNGEWELSINWLTK